ncbi:hypothetical protein H6G36_24070 [Anabaena minutissima FACHB-250]|nr:hypothetical protein [Anabaena minutissima FACHB-250]
MNTVGARNEIGLTPLVLMGLSCLKMMIKMHNLSKKNPNYFLQTSTVIAGLSCLLSGSFSEALLLGNMSFPVMSLILYTSLGKYLIDATYKQQKEYFPQQAIPDKLFLQE